RETNSRVEKLEHFRSALKARNVYGAKWQLCPTEGKENLPSGRFSHSHLAKFGFEGDLKLLHIGGGWAITRFLRCQTEPPALINVPIRLLAIAESDFAADHRAGSGEMIDGN